MSALLRGGCLTFTVPRLLSTCLLAAAFPESLPQEFGFEPHEVEFRIAFGTGESAWTNHRREQWATTSARCGRCRRCQPEHAD